MKSKLITYKYKHYISLALLVLMTVVVLQRAWSQSSSGTLSIVGQPGSQNIEYGEDATFAVVVSDAEPLGFQWFRNGERLCDFENVAGSRTASLNIVGAAANDEGDYSVVVTNLQGGSITSAVAVLAIKPKIVFSDSFDAGSSNWLPLIDSEMLADASTRNHTLGGVASLSMSNSLQKVYHNLPVQYACRLDFSFWFYDDGKSQTSCGGELRGYSGPGYAKYISPGGLRQLIAIGRYNEAFPTNNAGMMAGEVFDPTKYQGRVMHGTNSGWFNLNTARSPGWHKFRIDRSGSAASGGKIFFYVDDALAKTVTGATMAAVDSIFLGSLSVEKSNAGKVTLGEGFFDNVVVQAYPGLFDWQSLKTKGPIPDWMRLRETGTNADSLPISPVTVSVVSGNQTNGSVGDWEILGSAIYSTGLCGTLDYLVTTTKDDAFRIQIEGRERNFKMPTVEMPVEVSVDGESLGRHNLEYGDQTNGLLDCFTPFIRAGAHKVRLHWDNADAYRSLLIQTICFQTLVSPTDRSDGHKEWVANRLGAQNGVEICPSTSFVSPACVEGRGQYLSMMNAFCLTPTQAVPAQVQHGAGNRWYANMPLFATNTTTMLFSFQNGGLYQTNEITWLPVNLATITNNFTIRKGDSLLLTVLPEGTINGAVELRINGAKLPITDASMPLPKQFDQPGVYTVSGKHLATGVSGSIAVNVVDASFEDSPIARVFHARYWNCTNLPAGVELDADPRLKVTKVAGPERSQQTPALASEAPNEKEFRIYTRSTTPQYVLARLGTNGPILANTAVRGFRWSIAPETYLRVIDTNPDGSQLIETAFVASPMFPNLSVGVQIISSGVVFDDGTVTKSMSAQDFDATGTAKVRFVRSPTARGSTCHTTKIYDKDVLIGWR